jgi:hypothetical protein
VRAVYDKFNSMSNPTYNPARSHLGFKDENDYTVENDLILENFVRWGFLSSIQPASKELVRASRFPKLRKLQSFVNIKSSNPTSRTCQGHQNYAFADMDSRKTGGDQTRHSGGRTRHSGSLTQHNGGLTRHTGSIRTLVTSSIHRSVKDDDSVYSVSRGTPSIHHSFKDDDSGYHSGVGASSIGRSNSIMSQADSRRGSVQTELDRLYRVACHELHEPKFPNEGRDMQPCILCHYSNTHNLASIAKNLMVEEFRDELRLDVYEIMAIDAAGNSALHYAAAFGASYSHLNALIDAGVPPYQLNTANQNFFHCLRPLGVGSDGYNLSSIKASLFKLFDRLDSSIMGQQDNDGQTVLHTLASQITEPELREQAFK